MATNLSGKSAVGLPAVPRRRPVGLVAAGIAVVAVLLQVFFGRLLGTIDWNGCFCAERAQAWTPSITAQVWYTASSVLIAALLSRRLLARGGPPMNKSEYYTAIVPPAVTVLFAVPLVVALAAGARSPRAIPTGIDIGASMPVGALLGGLAAAVVLSIPVLVRSIWWHFGWIWLLGLLSVVVSWRDHVGQTVPIGSILVGGPGSGATPIDQTLHGVTASLMTVVAILGPAVIGGWLAWHAKSASCGLWESMAVGVAGPCFALAAYVFRPDALTGDNAAAARLALETLLIAGIASGAVLFGYSLWNQPVSTVDPQYQSRHRQ